MKLTKLLKEWLVEDMQVDKDADDDTYRGSLGQAVSEDKLSSKKLAELTEDPDAGNANEDECKENWIHVRERECGYRGSIARTRRVCIQGKQ